MHDLHRRVNFEKSDFLARFEGDLESSGNDGRCVRLEDVMPPSETDWPSLRRFPTGEVTVVAYESLSLSFSYSILCGRQRQEGWVGSIGRHHGWVGSAREVS